MTRTQRTLLGIVTGFMALTLCGCSSGAKGVRTPRDEIPVKVWVVLDTGEVVGGSGNNGCRLSMSEITDFVDTLVDNRGVYGSNVKITWDGTISTFRDNLIGFFREDNINSTFITSLQIAPPGIQVHDPNKVNIYFTGNYIAGTDSQGLPIQLWGATVEPGAFMFPFIIVNDGGFLSFSGDDAAGLASRLTVEHEMAHFLGRFTGRTFGSGVMARSYSASEHVNTSSLNGPDPGATFNLLLEGGDVPIGGSRALNLPGASEPSPRHEVGEISTRVRQGRVLVP